MSKKFSITIIEAPDQNQRENPNNQFSNSEPMTFAQKVDYVKNIDMTNNKQQTAVEWFSVRRDVLEIEVRLGKLSPIEYAEELTKAEQQAKAMQKQQAEHYATFITNCVINNLPTITFNDWINLHNNEQQ
jgi:hypothetical protein